MTCDELRDHYELYALGVADDPEAGEIREHIARADDPCVNGVRAARGLVTLIGATAPAADPPARLRTRVLALAARETPQRRNWWLVWAAFAAGAVIAAVFFVSRMRDAQEQVAHMESQLVSQVRDLERLHQAMAILNQPDARQVVFGGAQPQPPRGRVFLDPRRGVLLLASNLPPAPFGKTYEMWVIPKAPGSKPVPAGLFQSAGDGTAIHVLPGPVDVAGTGVIAVTLEPDGGVPQPTTQPVIAAPL